MCVDQAGKNKGMKLVAKVPQPIVAKVLQPIVAKVPQPIKWRPESKNHTSTYSLFVFVQVWYSGQMSGRSISFFKKHT